MPRKSRELGPFRKKVYGLAEESSYADSVSAALMQYLSEIQHYQMLPNNDTIAPGFCDA